MERQPLSKVYTSILKSLFCQVAEDGTVSNINGEPYLIGDKTVVIPTQELLRENEWDKKAPFHPLCEDAIAGQSDMTRWLIKRVNAAITMNVCHLVTCALQIAQTQALQGEIKDGSYTQFIEILSEAKEATQKFFAKLVKAYGTEDTSTVFSNLYVSRAGQIGDKTYARIATLEIPMLTQNDNDGFLQGVKAPNKADKRMIIDFVAKLFEGVQLEVGANSGVPYFEALMRLYYNVANRLNKVRKILKGGLPESAVDIVSLTWHKWLDDGMDDQIGSIPPLPGNIGPVDKPKKPRNTVSAADVELGGLTGRTNVPAARVDDTPPWNDEPRDRNVEPQPARASGGGISVLSSGNIRNESDRDRGGRDRDRDRDYGRDRDDRGRDRPRVNIFDRDDRGRGRDRDYDRDDRGRGRDRDRRRDDYDRDDRGGISILGRR